VRCQDDALGVRGSSRLQNRLNWRLLHKTYGNRDSASAQPVPGGDQLGLGQAAAAWAW
jgi:hypothetical protein